MPILYEGRQVRYGRVYRGGAMDEWASYMDDEARKVFHCLGIRTEIELRGDKTHPDAWWDENNRRVFRVKADGYQRMLSPDEEGVACLRAAFNALADAQNYPVCCHCSAGADRTGTFIFLLYSLLGIPYAVSRTDYQLTSFSLAGVREAKYVNDRESLDDTRTLLLDRCGDGTGDLRRAAENFLVSFIGLPRESLDAIRRNLLE